MMQEKSMNLFVCQRLFPSQNGEEGPVSVRLSHSWVELTLSWAGTGKVKACSQGGGQDKQRQGFNHT